MGESRFRTGAAIAGLGGVALLLAMFGLDWYGVDGIAFKANAWDAYNLIDFGLLAVAVIGIGFALLAFTLSDRDLGIPSLLTAAAGTVGFAVILVRTISPPDLEVRNQSIKELGGDITNEIGVFLGLIAIAAIAVGGFVAMRASGTTLGEGLRRVGDSLTERDSDDHSETPPSSTV